MTLQRLLIPIIILALLGIGYFYFAKTDNKEAQEQITSKVRKGEFVINITATGELKAKRSVKIKGPKGMRNARIYQSTISDMVPEGTVVKEGEYVASLDRTEIDQKLKEAQTEMDKIMTQLDQAKIDTAIEMRGIRDNLINLKFERQEKLLEVEQSKYEAQSVIQSAKIDLQRSDRDYNQLLSKLQLTKEKSEAKISEINTSLKQEEQKMGKLRDLAQACRVMAPKDGMVIYAKGWEGKIGPGSTVNAWNPVVAELPDLSDMVSKAFVNEVDISRVKKGQEVKVKIDAFPDREYSGQVIKIANIGEQLKNYDAKVFEVVIQVEQADSILRPAMTTSNEVVTDVLQDKVAIPLEGLFSDSLTYVFKVANGTVVKKEVIAGMTNDQEVIIDHGLAENDDIYLTAPEDAADLDIVLLDQKIKDDIKRKQEEARIQRQKEITAKMEAVKNEEISDDNGGGGGFIIFN